MKAMLKLVWILPNSLLFIKCSQQQVIAQATTKQKVTLGITWPKSNPIDRIWGEIDVAKNMLLVRSIELEKSRYVDLSVYLPKVGNQNKGKCCTAFAAVWTMNSIIHNMALGNNVNKKPELLRNWKEFVYNPIIAYQYTIRGESKINTASCGNETELSQTISNACLLKGIKISELPLPDESDPCRCNLIPDNQLVKYINRDEGTIFKIRDINQRTDESLINELLSGHPILMGFAIPDSFYELGLDPKWNNLYEPSKLKLKKARHAAVIVGYDADGEVFKVANSYGDDWGDEGYFYIKRGLLDKKFINNLGNLEPVVSNLYTMELNLEQLNEKFNNRDVEQFQFNELIDKNDYTLSELVRYYNPKFSIFIRDISQNNGARIIVFDIASKAVFLNRIMQIGDTVAFYHGQYKLILKSVKLNTVSDYGNYANISILRQENSELMNAYLKAVALKVEMERISELEKIENKPM